MTLQYVPNNKLLYNIATGNLYGECCCFDCFDCDPALTATYTLTTTGFDIWPALNGTFTLTQLPGECRWDGPPVNPPFNDVWWYLVLRNSAKWVIVLRGTFADADYWYQITDQCTPIGTYTPVNPATVETGAISA